MNRDVCGLKEKLLYALVLSGKEKKETRRILMQDENCHLKVTENVSLSRGDPGNGPCQARCQL